MNKKAMLTINWSFFILGFITTFILLLLSERNDSLMTLGGIIFFSIMFLAGFIGLNIQYKEK